MALALLVSLLSHLLVLSLTFGGDKQGLPGFIAPWRDRRIELPDLRIVLVPAPVSPAEPALVPAAEPPQRVTINAPVAGGPASALPESQAPSPPVTAVPAVTGAPAAETTARADATPDAVAIVARVEAPAPPARPDLAAPVQTPEPAGVAARPADAPSPIVLAASLSPTFVIAAAPSASSPQTVLPEFQGPSDAAQQAQREQAARQ